ncbi:3'(2'),5'-bisphosphate nucleotidase CysQ [Prochlorococcus sp. AH-716-E13]|nr:3'(2'),5'-bisphosphate nucleotidase CysQ [Prochlorococcus sp. AH-716-E13]
MVNLPEGVNIYDLIDDLRTLCWEAADVLIYYSNILRDPNIKINIIKDKNIDNPVTKADIEANEIIIKGITEKYKNISWEILSEETVKFQTKSIDTNSEWLWVLDPLDGTKDFIQGTNNYALHLALNYKQKPYIGIVLIPEKDELWISNGFEVWCENKNGLKTKPKISNHRALSEMTLVMSKNHNNENLNNLIEKINFKKVLVMGSIGCKIASIIRGESDLYISLSLPGNSSPKDWDFAAPAAILTAAGGAITNLDNVDLNYNKVNFDQGGIIIASNNKLNHKKICSEIREIVEKNKIYPF